MDMYIRCKKCGQLIHRDLYFKHKNKCKGEYPIYPKLEVK